MTEPSAKGDAFPPWAKDESGRRTVLCVTFGCLHAAQQSAGLHRPCNARAMPGLELCHFAQKSQAHGAAAWSSRPSRSAFGMCFARGGGRHWMVDGAASGRARDECYSIRVTLFASGRVSLDMRGCALRPSACRQRAFFLPPWPPPSSVRPPMETDLPFPRHSRSTERCEWIMVLRCRPSHAAVMASNVCQNRRHILGGRTKSVSAKRLDAASLGRQEPSGQIQMQSSHLCLNHVGACTDGIACTRITSHAPRQREAETNRCAWVRHAALTTAIVQQTV